jgi:hypothetical protein
VKITSSAGQAEVRRAIVLPVLLGHHMLDVEPPVNGVLRQAAILAPIASAAAHEFAKAFLDHRA